MKLKILVMTVLVCVSNLGAASADPLVLVTVKTQNTKVSKKYPLSVVQKSGTIANILEDFGIPEEGQAIPLDFTDGVLWDIRPEMLDILMKMADERLADADRALPEAIARDPEALAQLLLVADFLDIENSTLLDAISRLSLQDYPKFYAFMAERNTIPFKDNISSLCLRALENNNDQFFIWLIQSYKIDPNLILKNGLSLLHNAVYSENQVVATLLLQHGANPNIFDPNGITPLMAAVGINNRSLTELLLGYGANIDLQDSHGETALMLASRSLNDAPLVGLLLHWGADHTLKNVHNQMAADIASQMNNQLAMQTFERYERWLQEEKQKKKGFFNRLKKFLKSE